MLKATKSLQILRDFACIALQRESEREEAGKRLQTVAFDVTLNDANEPLHKFSYIFIFSSVSYSGNCFGNCCYKMHQLNCFAFGCQMLFCMPCGILRKACSSSTVGMYYVNVFVSSVDENRVQFYI